MNERRSLAGRPGSAAVLALGLAAASLIAGCGGTLGYYMQSVQGHLALSLKARPVADWLADPTTPEALRNRLQLSQRIRDYAVTELKEPDNASYRRYADLGRSAAVWNVVAAPELSLVLQTWCFPVVGCVGYRGYYDRAAALAFADGLKAQGLEVSVYGVPAYSTLGRLPGTWLADPLLNTFIDEPEADLARLIFHELAHQIVYAPGDTEFNESFATSVERLGGERWLRDHASLGAREASAQQDARREDFQHLTLHVRQELEAVYRSGASDAEKRAAKAGVMARLRADYDSLKAERWGGYAGYDGWIARANNATFGVLAAYNGLTPGFGRLFDRSEHDFNRFYAEVGRIADLPKAERRSALP